MGGVAVVVVCGFAVGAEGLVVGERASLPTAALPLVALPLVALPLVALPLAALPLTAGGGVALVVPGAWLAMGGAEATGASALVGALADGSGLATWLEPAFEGEEELPDCAAFFDCAELVPEADASLRSARVSTAAASPPTATVAAIAAITVPLWLFDCVGTTTADCDCASDAPSPPGAGANGCALPPGDIAPPGFPAPG